MSEADLLNKVLAKAAAQEQAEVKVLHNAQVSTLKAYQSDSSASALKNWQAAKGAYQQELDGLAYKYGLIGGDDETVPVPTPESFAELKDVLAYLDRVGWKVARASIFKHQSEKKIKRDKSTGRFMLAAVEKYAGNHLKRKDGSNPGEDQTRLQERKVSSETRLKEAQAKKAELELDIALGKVIPRENLERELVGRGLIIDSSMRHLLKMGAPEWIELVGGDQAQVGLLRDAMMELVDRLMNTFASTHDFMVDLELKQ